MANVKQIIERAYTKASGEYELFVEASDDFNTYLNILNQTMASWARTPYVKWQSLFDIDYTLPDPVVAEVTKYNVVDADTVKLANSPYDSVYFVDDDNKVVSQFKMVDQAVFQSTEAQDVCCLVKDGLHLKSVPEEIVGTKIKLPVYVMPPEYTTATQEVRIDSTQWLVTAMAAFVASSSPVPFIARNADRYEKEAAVLMKDMKEQNRRRQHLVIKKPAGGGAGRQWADVMQRMTLKDL